MWAVHISFQKKKNSQFNLSISFAVYGNIYFAYTVLLINPQLRFNKSNNNSNNNNQPNKSFFFVSDGKAVFFFLVRISWISM